MNLGADTLRWGGAVFTPDNEELSAQMGSGVFEEGNAWRTAYMNTLRLRSYQSPNPAPPNNDYIVADESRCYLTGDNGVIPAEEMKMNYLKTEQHKHITKTIKTAYGDIYDCTLIYKQPGLNHPLLKNHKVQMRPGKEVYDALNKKNAKGGRRKQVKVELDEGCPPGTVPIRRITQYNFSKDSTTTTTTSIFNSSRRLAQLATSYGFEFAGIQTAKGAAGQYLGAAASMSVWNPKLNGAHQYSSSLIIVESFDHSNLIHVGWTVNPDVYGDSLTHHYLLWTADNYKTTGCFNTHCPGFVQTSSTTPIDSTITDISIRGKVQRHFTVEVTLDSAAQWWLLLGGTPVGYWPNNVFKGMNLGADTLRWGGAVLTPDNEELSAQMGSGAFKEGSAWRTAYMNTLRVRSYQSPNPAPPNNNYIVADESRCYLTGDNGVIPGTVDDYVFCYGSRIRNGQCI
ncbi:protein neprosin-like [Malania oleifera]|uniref:protein neprosin-like n=1 Tax=Malania oleifera TaxID=397392 RepID=UPI0025AD9EF3|nr:protein neprosin-like [Malania oleifera]